MSRAGRSFARTLARRALALVFALALVLGAEAPASAREKLKVLVPEKDNLQYMAFWVAKAGGFFDREGIDLELVVAPQPNKTEKMFEQGEADAAVLAPPMYLRLVAAKKPVVLVANLLRHDPLDLVIRREVMLERKLSPDMPVAERIKGLKGLRIGFAAQSHARLQALLATQGMSIENDIQREMLLVGQQSGAFHDKKVDALYAPSPYLEKAIVADDGVAFVKPSAGEVKELSSRLVHGFAVTRTLFEGRSSVVLAAVRAISEAEKSIHASKAGAVEALARELPARARKELEVIVDLYEPAIPDAPEVRAEDLAPALALIPEGVPRPDLTGIELAPYVATDLGVRARTDDGGRLTRWLAAAVVVAVLVGIIALVRRGEKNRKAGEQGEKSEQGEKGGA